MSLVFNSVQKQVAIMRRNLHRLRQEVDGSEKTLLQICQVINEGLTANREENGIKSKSVNGNRNGGDSSTTLHNFIYPQDGIPDLQQLSIAMKNNNKLSNGNGLAKKPSSLSSIGPPYDINAPQREAAEWSVVEDDDDEDDRELTSASLSGYDDEYDSD